MTAVMLATYPEVFAGGGIIAGLPYGAAVMPMCARPRRPCAAPRSGRRMNGGDAVRRPLPIAGPWPKVSIWHGALDTTVNINNAQASVAQWADLHGVGLTDARQELVEGAVRLSWDDRLELYTLPLLGHGTPIDSHDVGTAAPFILQAGISSSRRIAGFWGLMPAAAASAQEPATPAPARPHISLAAEPPALPKIEAILKPSLPPADRRTNIILKALKAAGLIKKH